ncbi:MAG: C25 family cysteine peptidase, partial [bacterium]
MMKYVDNERTVKRVLFNWDVMNITNYEVTRSGSGFTISFQDRLQASSNTYFLSTPEVHKQPVTITKHEVSTLKSKQNGADYVIITHSDFIDALQPLAQQRGSKGLRVKTVAVQDIYDEFNYGIYDPRAIKAFLKYAYINWIPPAPTYVLLVGDTHFGFDKGAAHSWGKTSFVPTYMAYTVSWGATSSDNFFVTVSGDDPLPDMFIGRLPVNSVEETTAIVNKILNYENHPNFGEWRRKLALSVGNRDFFEQQADNLNAELIPEDFDVPRLYTNPHSPYFGSTEELVDIFKQGAAVLNFIGHGGGGVFFDSELFLLEDIVLLDNAERLPVAFSWSCFIGYFDNPWTPSLGEELLRVPDRGVVAHFGSAGRAWLYGDSFFNQALFSSLFRRNHRILGQVTTEAKMELLSNSGIYRDMVENYVLLGDPALKIGFPEKQISIQIQNPAIVEGDTLRIFGSLEEPLNGSVNLSFYNERDSLITSQEFTVTQGQFNATHAIQNFPHGPYKVKAYFWNASTDGSGVSFFTVNRLHFSEVRFLPAKPTHLDTVHFFTKFTRNFSYDSLQVEAVNCQWSWDRTNWNSLMMSPFEDGYKSEIPISVLEGRTLFYKFVAIIDHTSAFKPDTLFSRLFSYYIPKRADLTLS